MRSAPRGIDYLSTFICSGAFPLTSLPGPSLLPNNFAALKEQLDKSDFIVGYAGSNCFGATASQLGEGLPSKDPQIQVKQETETCVAPVIGEPACLPSTRPKSQPQPVFKSKSFFLS